MLRISVNKHDKYSIYYVIIAYIRQRVFTNNYYIINVNTTIIYDSAVFPGDDNNDNDNNDTGVALMIRFLIF